MKLIAALDADNIAVKNFVEENLSSDPGSPATGRIWLNTTTPVLRYYNGTKVCSLYDGVSTNTANTVVLRDGSGNFTANVATLAQGTISGTPTNSTDIATKGYVDSTAQGLSAKGSVVAASTAALAANTYANGTSGVGATLTANANGALALDGVSLNVNDAVLIKDEGTTSHNGRYVVTQVGDGSHPYILTRATDMDASTEIVGAFIFVEGGTVNGSSGWVCTTTGAVTMGTTGITFTQFSGAGEISVTAPIAKSGNTISVNLSARVVNTGGNLDLGTVGTASTYTSVTTDAYGRVTSGADIITSNGIVTRTAAGTFTNRTMTGTTNRLSVTNGDGVSGNPTFDISSSYVGQASITTLGTIATGVWSGTAIAIASGGTGQTSASAAFNALSPITTLGDLIYGSGSNANSRLAGPTSATKQFLTSTGNGSVAAAPAWGTIALADLPSGVVKKVVTAGSAGTSTSVAHNLGTSDVVVSVRDTTASPNPIDYADVTITDANNLTVTTASSYTSGQLQITVIG